MSATLLAATGRPRRLVNRVSQLQQVKEAIFPDDNRCHIVLIKGKGGLGKTRFLEEIRRRLGNPDMMKMYGTPSPEEDWSKLEPSAVVCDPIEFGDVKMIAREYLLEKLGDPALWNRKVPFNKFDVALRREKRLLDLGASATILRTVADETEKAFWEDYKQAIQKHRLVILMDTSEHLARSNSRWLLENKILSPEELLFSTPQWLLEKIKTDCFQRATIIIAGRNGEDEGDFFFEELSKVTAESNCIVTELAFDNLNFAETCQFFEAMREDWPDETNVGETLSYLLSNQGLLRVLYHYTGGQPVRLSLYVDIIIEGRTIPEQLREPFDGEKHKTDAKEIEESEEIKQARKTIESQFIELLFDQPDDLHSQILQILVRSPRGLTTEELFFVLYYSSGEDINSWKIKNDEAFQNFEKTIVGMMNLSIIRVKADGHIGLQDELYRIYAEQMVTNETKKKREVDDRKNLYELLRDRAKTKYEQVMKQWSEIIREDLQRIQIGDYANILNTRLPKPTTIEDEERRAFMPEILHHELEFIHYAFLIDPQQQFNEVYDRISNAEELALSEGRVAIIQAEMWRLLRDPYVAQFVNVETRPEVKERGETTWDVLRRVADQDSAVKSIMRLTLRGHYQRAIERANKIDEIAGAYKDVSQSRSWNHTFTKGERHGWREYARILGGRSIPDALDELKRIVGDLEKLRTTSRSEIAFPDDQTRKFEKGFAGSESLPKHPAYPRLVAIIASIYNSIGYGYVTLGDSRKAVENYTKALQYLRETSDEAQQARVRNNLSRALVDMSKSRSIRICQDGLELRIKLGRLHPIGLSYNTLGLIMNDLNNPSEAIEACARALAIARAIEDSRLTMLVLTQLGEALRRWVVVKGNLLADKGEAIYREAMDAIEQAREIAMSREESARTIETAIEMGCLYRDWLLIIDKSQLANRWEQHYQNALRYLQEANEMAGTTLIRLALDAQVNIAWTHYYANALDEAKKFLEEPKQLIRNEAKLALLEAGAKPPASHVVPSYFFQQLSKIYNLIGRIAFDRLFERIEDYKQKAGGKTKEGRAKEFKQDNTAHDFMKDAAEAYTQAVGYAQLYSTHSHALSAMYEALYGYLKKLNEGELRLFYQYVTKAQQDYRAAEIRPENLSDLEGFLSDCFGDYYPTVQE